MAIIEVISGLSYKQGEGVNSALYCMPFETEEYLTTDSTAVTAITALTS